MANFGDILKPTFLLTIEYITLAHFPTFIYSRKMSKSTHYALFLIFNYLDLIAFDIGSQKTRPARIIEY